MIFNIHAGHNPDGKIACGAIGLIKESTEARKIKDKAINILRQQGHTVYDCTADNGISQKDILKKIVAKSNAHTVDCDISIHFNSGAKDHIGNRKTTGVEVFTYSASSKANNYAKNICNEIAHFGLKNRGIKYNKNLYFLKNTKSPALLIEVAFVDDRDDVNTYLKNIDNIANAIVKGILGKTTDHPGEPSTAAGLSSIYDYKLVFDPAYYANKYPDLKSVLGTDAPKLFHHFKSYGMKEGRQGISTFNVIAYKNRYADLRKAFGNSLELYYNHYITCGYKENRIGT